MADISTHRQRRYPPELRERAVRLVAETAAERGDRHGAVTHVARQLGIGPESLRNWRSPRSAAVSATSRTARSLSSGWVHQAAVDAGDRSGLTTEERERIKVLEREIRELRRANEILKSAAALIGCGDLGVSVWVDNATDSDG